MSNHQVEKLLNDYSVARYGISLDYDSLKNVINFGIANGYLQMVEREHPHTFGGYTVLLTDSELANVMSLTSRNQKISAIKEIRNKGTLSLREAKHFIDHLSEVMNKLDRSGF